MAIGGVCSAQPIRGHRLKVVRLGVVVDDHHPHRSPRGDASAGQPPSSMRAPAVIAAVVLFIAACRRQHGFRQACRRVPVQGGLRRRLRRAARATAAQGFGGRAAEEIVFGEITTGASNDLEKVTATAKNMVMRYGMSERLGPRVFGHDHSQPFLGREFSSEPDYSDEIAREIDDEIRRVVESAHQRARDILTEHRESLGTISEILVRRETIEQTEFEALIDGKSESEVFAPSASGLHHTGDAVMALAADDKPRLDPSPRRF
jgi:hypothetical protein